MDDEEWIEAVGRATAGLSLAGARERRRHARQFTEWCQAEGISPMEITREAIARHFEAVAGLDRGLASKIRCSLRAVMSVIDRERAAQTLGLGCEPRALLGLGEPVARLVEITIHRRTGRSAVRRSALRRLFAWAREVDAAPESLTAVDMPQFRAWLLERGNKPAEILVVARDFVELRWSPFGCGLLGKPPIIESRVRLVPPLPPRFVGMDQLPRASSRLGTRVNEAER